ncbi:hypothetical protein NLX83_06895 [Allokutzneria sp. A3M-2-11 16]|uniref:hypothetical protein n=1 Tax=Allokutzneria sp. A3M-2-11 16 TaxID=2962043 RepID=UPI0020B7B2E5|nr:hypothetical protein [Allokutzneria sp. A3M-2-11 16]MCP3798979.1 hypothetical protein [Allokutzneria sp. A3M-2-11 16]
MASTRLRRAVASAALCAAMGTTLLTTGPASLAAPAESTWTPDLTQITEDSANVRFTGGALRLAGQPVRAASAMHDRDGGSLVVATRELAAPANRIGATVDATVPGDAQLSVDVRGELAGGEWSEWTTAPAELPEATKRLQVRVAMVNSGDGRSPEVRGVRLSAESGPQVAAEPRAAARSYRVYATREGLVGGTTANGHVIKSRDHFVALPSGKSLAPKNTGTYSVKVCTASRCAWGAVWDKGPWNIKDDYWNPSAQREMWKNLPQGKPEAQAAYQDKYNGGKDGFGRVVQNPAGIDLADGTFWDGLKLSDNAWVTATYLWTGTGTFGTVRSTAGGPVNVRNAAKTGATQVGMAGNHARAQVECQVTGDSVTGSQGTSNVWFRIHAGMYIPKAFVSGVASSGAC